MLLDACTGRHPEWNLFRDDLKLLTQYAVIFRYPGESASKEEARHAVKAAAAVREIIKPLLQGKKDAP